MTAHSAVFPCVQGSLHSNALAAKTVSLGEAFRLEFGDYGRRVVGNARALAATLQERRVGGGGGSDTHLVVPDVSSVGLLGREGESALARAGITSNNNPIPFDARNPSRPKRWRSRTRSSRSDRVSHA